jgi:5-methylcytosine-specific restriction protein A
MSRLIRVDAQVFAALQQLATPLIDTPNDVLRRLLKLNRKERDVRTEHRQLRSDSGRRINARYKLGAKHALYHIDGTFFERLERFPGFLADAGGYVWYSGEEEFLTDPFLEIGDKVNVHGELANHPRYKRFPKR